MKTALVIVFVVACGGGGKKSDVTNTGGTPTGAGSTADDGVYGGATYGGYKRTPELTAFHDAIATRTTLATACPASAQLHDAASAIKASAPPPGANAEMFSGEANELVGLTEDFVTACTGTDTAMTQDDLDSMHRSYQRLLLLIPASP